ncbi:hypothetical protein EV696_12613 [Permianibacter aggregans]|uniref:Uncharacterized protein n=2 Tax=Permianibacter aggregans TaxID=1510150 RepID=A0A4R6UBY5_9GAMM|nr:hypothetical protein EV696_12613 [Permianibacter aggregans]
MDISKGVFAILGVIVGGLMAPLVASWTRRFERKAKMSEFYTELDDLRSHSERMIIMLAHANDICAKAKKNIMPIQDAEKAYSLPSPLTFYIIEKNCPEIYSSLTIEQRRAVRAIMNIVSSLNSKLAKLSEMASKSVLDQDVSLIKAALYEACSFKYVSERLCNERDRFIYFQDKTNDDIAKDVLAAFNINII